VTHKNMMTISGTHIQGLHSTQVRHHTQIDLLTCRVCFVKHVMINTQVRHHTHLDVTTCRVCSVKHVFSHNLNFLISLFLVGAILYNFGSDFVQFCHPPILKTLPLDHLVHDTPLVLHSVYLWSTPVGARPLRG